MKFIKKFRIHKKTNAIVKGFAKQSFFKEAKDAKKEAGKKQAEVKAGKRSLLLLTVSKNLFF